MAFHVYPDYPTDAQLTPQSVPANSVFPVPPAPPMAIDLSVGTGTTKIMRLVTLPLAASDPHVIFKADTGDEVEVSPTGFTFPVFNLPGNTGAEVLDVIMTLDNAASGIYKLELFLFGSASFGIRIKNTDAAAAHEYSWVVADSDADSQQPWISLASPTLQFNVLTNQSVQLGLEVDNQGTGALVIADAAGLALGSTFTLTGVPGAIMPNQAVPSKIQITFAGGASPGPSSATYNIASNDTIAPNPSVLRNRIALSAKTGKLEIALVLDGSGSMGAKPDGTPVGLNDKSRWDWLRSASQDLLDLLNTFASGAGHFAIDTFPNMVNDPTSPESGEIEPVQDISPGNISAAQLALNNSALVPTNSTPMSAGINRALGYFDNDANSKQFNQRFMILMSDGANNLPPDPSTLFQTGPTSFTAYNVNALTIGFGLLTATIYQVNWGLLQQIASWSPAGAFHDSGTGDTGAGVDGVMGLTLHKVFEVALSTALSLSWGMDPRDTLTAASPEKRYSIGVLPYDRKVAFVVRWTTFGRAVQVEVETPNCEIVTAASAPGTPGVFYSSNPLYQIFSFDESYLRNTPPGRPRDGAWNLLVSINPDDGLGDEIFEYSVITDSRLKMQVSFDQKIYYAGDTVGVTARLTLDGLPVRHATVVIEQAGPGQSLDNFLANSIVTAADLSKAQAAAGTTDYNAIGLRSQALQLKGQTFTLGNAPTTKPMTDPGNIGVYRASFSNTSVPGNYDYYVVAIGQTADGVSFRREQQLYMRLDVNPSPAYTLVDVLYQLSAFGVAPSAQVTIYPRNAHLYPLMIDPTSDSRLSVSVQNAQLVGGLVFNGNGSYTQHITYGGGTVPTVGASMNGAVLVPPQLLAPITSLNYPDFVMSYVPGREASPGANVHNDPTAVLGNVATKPKTVFLSLGAFGSVAVGVKNQVIVAQGPNDITIFARLDSDLRSYKVEALPENQTNWVLLGTSPGTTQSFGLAAAGLKTALAVRVSDTSARTFDFSHDASPSPGFSWYGAGLVSTGAPSELPVIASENGVVNGASLLPGLSSGSWVTVKGSNLSVTTRTWGPADIVNGKLPTSLDGTGVTFNGQPGYVYYVSPTQINVVAPPMAAGAVQVQVFSNWGMSQVVTVQAGVVSPGLFLILQNQRYVLALHADGTIVGNPSAIPGVNCSPAAPGETITITGTGFGPTRPPEPPGMVVTKPAPLGEPVTFTVGGVQAALSSAIVHDVGDVTFTLVVPTSLKAGDAAVIATVGGVQSQSGVMITIASPISR